MRIRRWLVVLAILVVPVVVLARDYIATSYTMSSGTLLGRSAGGSGVAQEITIGSGLLLSAGVLSNTGGGGGLSDADYGDITVSGTGTVMTIDNNVVSNAKAADMAANTIKANATAGTADPADLAVGTNTVVGRVGGNIVAAQLVTAQITDANVTFAKIQSATGPGVLGRAAGTNGVLDLITCANGSVLQGIGGNLACTTIDGASLDDGTVPYAKIQSVTDARLLGRSAGSAGAPMEITIGSGLSLVAGELAATGGGGGLSYAQVSAAALAGF